MAQVHPCWQLGGVWCGRGHYLANKGERTLRATLDEGQEESGVVVTIERYNTGDGWLLDVIMK